jgi:hypothetical protein
MTAAPSATGEDWGVRGRGILRRPLRKKADARPEKTVDMWAGWPIMHATYHDHREVKQVVDSRHRGKQRLCPVNAWPWRGWYRLSGGSRGLLGDDLNTP